MVVLQLEYHQHKKIGIDMTIKVNYKRSVQDITVQFINDGYVTCNHDGAGWLKVGHGLDEAQMAWACDKCPAQLIYGEWI